MSSKNVISKEAIGWTTWNLVKVIAYQCTSGIKSNGPKKEIWQIFDLYTQNVVWFTLQETLVANTMKIDRLFVGVGDK